MTDLPHSWAWTTLGEIADVVSGSTPRTSEPAYWNGEIPWITPDDLSKNPSKLIRRGARCITEAGYKSCSTRLVPPGTVLYTSRAPIGYAAIAANAVCTNQGFKSFVPTKALTSDYLYWFLNFATPSIRKLGSGTTFPELSKTRAREIPIPLPPLAEQRRIVAAIEEHLSRLDAGTAETNSADSSIGHLRSRLLDEVLEVEGDRVEVGSLVAAGRKIAYGVLQPGRHVVGGIRFVRVGDIDGGRIRGSLKEIDPAIASRFPRTELRGGEVLLTVVGTIGRTAVVGAELAGANVARAVAVIPLAPGIEPEFVALVLGCPRSVERLSVAAHEVARKTLNLEDVRRFEITLPSRETQRAVADEVEMKLSCVEALDGAVVAAQRRAQALRTAILARAFGGGLIPQDPDDEPASALLERIAAERASAQERARKTRPLRAGSA